MTTDDKLLTLHRAIIPAYDTIRETLPQLISYTNDDYPEQAKEIRNIAATWFVRNEPSLETVNLTRLAELIEIVWEMH